MTNIKKKNFLSTIFLSGILVFSALTSALILSSPAQPAYAAHPNFGAGDVFVSIANGQVAWYHSDGTLNSIIDCTAITGGGFTAGMAFDAADNLYVTMFNSNTVCVVDTTGTPTGTFGSGYNSAPESIVFDASGDAYVGQADLTADILKFDSAGNPLGPFNVATEVRGSDWIDLASDQCTMFYTSEGFLVKRYDVCNFVQLADFAVLSAAPAFAIKLLPDGGLLVANSVNIKRLDAAGTTIATYDVTGNNDWFALTLGSDGTSFWSADRTTADVCKFNLTTSVGTDNELLCFNTGTGPITVHGLAVIPNSPPVITAPLDVTAECNEFGGATGVNLGVPTVVDPRGNDLPPTNDAVEPFSLGDTTVTWSVMDTGGASDSDTQTVTVVDTTAPDIITVPVGFMAIANTNGGWSGDIGEATATDICDSSVDILNDAPDVFPLGDTTVEWCATDDEGLETCDSTQIINVKPLPVDIDIKPASDPNSINVKSNGVVPVAILGSDTIDVTLIDVTSLAFGPSGATPAHDLTDADIYSSHLEDVPVIDGITDLVSHYKQKQIGLSSGDTEACITGTYDGGIPFEGCDAVNIK